MTATPLQWGKPSPQGDLRASAAPGAYVIKRYGAIWEALAVFRYATEIYSGLCKSDALAAAEAHHVARVRRLAWERYMRENDPPIAHELPRVDEEFVS